jgi:hypothetical protein
MANEGPSLTKATYDKKRQPKTIPSPERARVELAEKARIAARLRRLDKLERAKDFRGALRELGLVSGEPAAQCGRLHRIGCGAMSGGRS